MINLTWQQEFNANFSMPLSFCRHKGFVKLQTLFTLNSGILAQPKSELPMENTRIFQHPLGIFSPLFDTII